MPYGVSDWRRGDDAGAIPPERLRDHHQADAGDGAPSEQLGGTPAEVSSIHRPRG